MVEAEEASAETQLDVCTLLRLGADSALQLGGMHLRHACN